MACFQSHQTANRSTPPPCFPLLPVTLIHPSSILHYEWLAFNHTKPHIDLPLLVLPSACFLSHQTAHRSMPPCCLMHGLFPVTPYRIPLLRVASEWLAFSHARLHNYRSSPLSCFPLQGLLSVTLNTYRSIPEPRNGLKREMALGPHSKLVYPLLYFWR